MAGETASMKAGLITLIERAARVQANERKKDKERERFHPLDFPYHPSVPFFILERNKTRVVRAG